MNDIRVDKCYSLTMRFFIGIMMTNQIEQDMNETKEFIDVLNRQVQNASSQRMFNSSGLTDVLSRLQRTAETFCYGGLAKSKRSVTKDDYDKKWKFHIAPYYHLILIK